MAGQVVVFPAGSDRRLAEDLTLTLAPSRTGVLDEAHYDRIEIEALTLLRRWQALGYDRVTVFELLQLQRNGESWAFEIIPRRDAFLARWIHRRLRPIRTISRDSGCTFAVGCVRNARNEILSRTLGSEIDQLPPRLENPEELAYTSDRLRTVFPPGARWGLPWVLACVHELESYQAEVLAPGLMKILAGSIPS
ncbi:MAG: hypothetical protein Q8R92_03640 [Deltaproteobacteria bacterium]|nr:hypothetical protein [Deltaproteobacteria bacterium]